MIASPPLRLVRLHLASRRAVPALVMIASCALALWMSMRWLPGSGMWPYIVRMVTVLGAAAVTGMAIWSPIGEAERASGRHLPGLRVGTVLMLLTASAIVFAVAGAGGRLPGGYQPMLRDLVGLTGITLLTAAPLGARHCWTLPLAYTVVCARGFELGWTSLWVWPARAPHDTPAAIVAFALLSAGLLVTALHGPREDAR